jgi:Kef-type K+ transport system membrane component KefB
MIVLTALNTLYAALGLTLLQGWLTLERLGDWLPAFARLGYNFLGSLLLAIVLARLVAVIARRLDLRNDNAVLLLLGLVLMAITGARTLGLSTLLVPLLAGMVLRNASDRPWVWPRHFGTAGGVLVLMLFVIVGSAWSIETLAAGASMAAVLVLARVAAKLLAVNAWARISGLSGRQGLALGVTLTPLSATALVMLADLYSVDPAFGRQLAPIVLSAIAMLELLGPLAVQWALQSAGEVTPGALGRHGKGAAPGRRDERRAAPSRLVSPRGTGRRTRRTRGRHHESG